MDCEELSDLEEGEILECESLSPCDGKTDYLQMMCRPSESSKKRNKSEHLNLDEKKIYDLCLHEEKKGCSNRSLKDKLKCNKEQEGTKSNLAVIDLESISSEGECKSDEEGKYFVNESKDYGWRNKERRPKEKHSTHFYGAVEDIMSEIGETICRKSRCNYKKRKSKDPEYSLHKLRDTSYDLWRHKIFSSHLKSRRHKRKISLSDSDSEIKKEKLEKKKKRIKRREVHYEENERDKKKPQKDFDEMRRNLLEKLKKQKAEQETKVLKCESSSKEENSEIQEVEMLIDCTNYVDNPTNAAIEISDNEEWKTEEKNREDELDLIKLRLIALESNKNKKYSESTMTSEKSVNILEKNNFSNNSRREIELDRNELLLRAEALKTALLKKHQKRLSKMKINKFNGIDNSNDNKVSTSLLSSHLEKNIEEMRPEQNAGNAETDSFKENVEKIESEISGNSSNVPAAQVIDDEMKINEMSESSNRSNASPQKIHSKTRSKRKKKKSGSFASNLKENSEMSELLEEDDRTLRSQLLSDLMKRKSLKDLEKKSVLMESLQTSANKTLPSKKCGQSPNENAKSLPLVKGSLLKKVNPPKNVKPMSAPSVPKPEIQRIIVHLGSEDSSDEDTDTFQPPCGLDAPEEKFSLLQEKEGEGNKSSFLKCPKLNKKEDNVVKAACERSVELLLNQARKKIEGKKQVPHESTSATPEAVYKHLPLSQRLEYMRLKQKIAERERLKKQKKENSLLPSAGDPQTVDVSTLREKEPKTVSETSTLKLGNSTEIDSRQKNLTSSSNSVSKINSCSSTPGFVPHLASNAKTSGGFFSLKKAKTKEKNFRLVHNEVKNNIADICGKGSNDSSATPDKERKNSGPTERNTLLLPFSQALLSKLKLLLKKIKIEKMIEENYEKEISKLKDQLSLFEKKKDEQRFKIKKLGEESVKTYKAIQGITAKSQEKENLKKDEWKEEKKDGSDDISEDRDKNVKEAVAEKGKKEDCMNVQKEPNTEIMNKSPIRTNIELNVDKEINENVASEKTSSASLLEYQSPLHIFNKVSEFSEKVDPNVMMCQFDLMGVCKDEECAYQHLRTS